MKKLLVAFSLVLASVAMLAQKDVTSAYNANKNGEYDKAANYIEAAILNPKANVKDKTWRYRGAIYLNIANSEEFAPKYPDAIKTASDSYVKAMELDTKDTYDQEDRQQLLASQAMSMNSGINSYNEAKYVVSADMFELGAEIAKILNITDTLAYFNAALAHEKSGNIERAIANYNECGELDYQVPEVYLFIASLQRNEMEDKEAALETLKSARVKYPKHPGLVIEELNIYLTDGNFENAQENLRVAIENDPENPVLHFSIGSVYDNLGKKNEAVVAYLESIKYDPEYFDANYNLGALYFNQAVESVNKANEIPANQNSKYKAAMEEANAVFANALPYLEKAYVLNDSDEGTIRSLKDIYIRVGNDEKYMEMKEKLDAQ
ncbi:MAG: tetratricopeptide (TPR) repeat protein [Litorivivens sp.]|jgi:tetratricopeptide (TPR) repeat protein